MSDQSVGKEFVLCANGHFFNRKTNSVCPFCGAGVAPAPAVSDVPLIEMPSIPLRRGPIELPPSETKAPKVEPVTRVSPPVTGPVPAPVAQVVPAAPAQPIPKPVKCRYGHWYDPQTNRECPYCKENAAAGKKRSGCLIPALLLAGLLVAVGAGLLLYEPQLAKLISDYRTDSARIELPAIAAFEAAPPQIQSGDTAMLRWSVSNAARISIEPGIGDVSGQQTDVHPPATTEYTLTATGRRGDVATSRTTVVVTAKAEPPPSVDSFTADPSTFDAGQEVVLHWTVRNATSIRIENVGDVTGEDHASVHPDATTTYKLTASSATGSASDSTTVTLNSLASRPVPTPPFPTPPVPSPPASIDSFTATPDTIERGRWTVLRWTVRNATGISIDHNVGSPQGGDSIIVHPDATTTYTLYASGAKSDTRSVTVTVNEPAPAPTPSPVTAADSGDLSCRGVSVPPHGEVFFHLPGGKLRFYNLDPPTAWKLHIKTLPDGTQQLFMASQLNTVQTYCALRWERLYVVEVAAFSRQADADTFATVLKSRGYKFTQVTGADKLIHFYVGGASTKKDGEAARAKLVADGFNAHFVPAP